MNISLCMHDLLTSSFSRPGQGGVGQAHEYQCLRMHDLLTFSFYIHGLGMGGINSFIYSPFIYNSPTCPYVHGAGRVGKCTCISVPQYA